jgi:hypothetical protein
MSMTSRPLILAGLLGASIGVPYVVSQTSGDARRGPAASSGAQYSAAVRPDGTWTSIHGPGAPGYESPTSLEATPVHPLAEVLRFDVTREWIYRSWARKSTGLADPELFGVRVPLVTGTGLADVAGSLTYYFNDQGQVQHIKLVGRTADTTQLVRFLVDTYGLERVQAPVGQQVYQVGHGSQVQSRLTTRPEPVLWATSPHASFSLELELERPGSSRYLPPPEVKLPLPETASAATAATPAATTADGAEAEEGEAKPALVGKFRAATAEEQRQLHSLRWPN